MVLFVLRSNVVGKDSFVGKQGDFIYLLAKGETLSLPKGSLGPDDSIMVMVFNGTPLNAIAIKTIELTHWVSMIWTTSHPEVYDKTVKKHLPV
jgi:hypothetical protein